VRTLLRALLILVIVVVVLAAAGAFFVGYRTGGHSSRGTVGTSGTVRTEPQDQQNRGPIDTSSAREKGAAIGEKLGEAGNTAAAFLSDASLTTKIKSKMSLDDHVKATDIGVSTTGHVVTLTGTVGSEDEHRRALDLARDTDGVKAVVDHIQVSRK
jgi:osmotically-inducible protein OsmY